MYKKGGTPSGATGRTFSRSKWKVLYGRTDAGAQLLVGYKLFVKYFLYKNLIYL